LPRISAAEVALQASHIKLFGAVEPGLLGDGEQQFHPNLRAFTLCVDKHPREFEHRGNGGFVVGTKDARVRVLPTAFTLHRLDGRGERDRVHV
jgi:hypothetical protein